MQIGGDGGGDTAKTFAERSEQRRKEREKRKRRSPVRLVLLANFRRMPLDGREKRSGVGIIKMSDNVTY